MPNSLDLWRENPGWPVDIDIIMDIYFDYRKYGKYPAAGGYFDQDTHIIDAFKLMNDQVEWHKQNEAKRANLPTMESLYSRRRAHHGVKGKR